VKTIWLANKEKHSAWHKAWVAKNRTEHLEYGRSYYKNNLDTCKESTQAWRETNPSKWRHIHANTEVKRRARKFSVFTEKYDRALILQRDKNLCCICEETITEKWPSKLSFSIQHIIPLSKGGEDSISNVAAAHWICNVRLGNKMMETN
jgi:5-methylcytosine-specific restriction endonuclease McrA